MLLYEQDFLDQTLAELEDARDEVLTLRGRVLTLEGRMDDLQDECDALYRDRERLAKLVDELSLGR